MTLQKLLLKLSNNKDIAVECKCYDNTLNVKIKEMYNFKLLDSIDIDLRTKLEVSKFLHYL